MQFQKTALALCAAGLLSLPGLVAASGGPSGPAVTFAVQGNIGEVIVNPYKLAPLKTDRKSNIKFPNDS